MPESDESAYTNNPINGLGNLHDLEDEWDILKHTEQDIAWSCEPRKIPDGLITPSGQLPLGHIALSGDFES